MTHIPANSSRVPSASRAPVLVGFGVAAQREQDYAKSLEAIDLVLRAVRVAADASGAAVRIQADGTFLTSS